MGRHLTYVSNNFSYTFFSVKRAKYAGGLLYKAFQNFLKLL